MALTEPRTISPKIDASIAKFRAVATPVLAFAAINKAVVVAILSVLSSASISAAITSSFYGSIWYFISAITIFLIVLAGTARSRYEAVPFLTFMLPTIFKILDLKDGD